jgi:hypothetical protein
MDKQIIIDALKNEMFNMIEDDQITSIAFNSLKDAKDYVIAWRKLLKEYSIENICKEFFNKICIYKNEDDDFMIQFEKEYDDDFVLVEKI